MHEAAAREQKSKQREVRAKKSELEKQHSKSKDLWGTGRVIHGGSTEVHSQTGALLLLAQ